MKSATLPSVRVEPELRAEVEALLDEGETLSEFVETSVRQAALRRRIQAEFLSRGLRSLENAARTDQYVEAEVVLDKLKAKLAAGKKRAPTHKR